MIVLIIRNFEITELQHLKQVIPSQSRGGISVRHRKVFVPDTLFRSLPPNNFHEECQSIRLYRSAVQVRAMALNAFLYNDSPVEPLRRVLARRHNYHGVLRRRFTEIKLNKILLRQISASAYCCIRWAFSRLMLCWLLSVANLVSRIRSPSE